MDTEILVPVSVLRALLLFTNNKSDPRYYLRSIYAECGPAGARLVATNGHILAAYKIDGEFAAASCIIPRELVESELRSIGKALTVQVGIGPPCRVGQLSAPAFEGHYPDYRKVIPRESNGELAHFDFGLLARVEKAAKFLGRKGALILAHNGPGPAIVNMGNPGFFALIMPYRIKPNEVPTVPAWTHEPVI